MFENLIPIDISGEMMFIHPESVNDILADYVEQAAVHNQHTLEDAMEARAAAQHQHMLDDTMEARAASAGGLANHLDDSTTNDAEEDEATEADIGDGLSTTYFSDDEDGEHLDGSTTHTQAEDTTDGNTLGAATEEVADEDTTDNYTYFIPPAATINLIHEIQAGGGVFVVEHNGLHLYAYIQQGVRVFIFVNPLTGELRALNRTTPLSFVEILQLVGDRVDSRFRYDEDAPSESDEANDVEQHDASSSDEDDDENYIAQ